MEPPVIELDEVSIAFGGKQVLDGLSMKVFRREAVVVVGRSGSGKTVLLKLMMGLLKPDRGRVRLFGRDLATASETEHVEIHRRMAMLFQNYALFDHLTVEDNVEFPLVEGARIPQRDAQPVAHELIRILDLEASERALPGELSGGMKKRVSLARALVAHPEVALFDEPTTGLDPLMVEQVDQLVASAKERYGLTTVIVSHDVSTMRRLADRVVFLHEGKIAFSGTYDAFLQSDLRPVRAFLAGSTPAKTSTKAPPGGPPMVELVGVHKWFGKKEVLRGLDLAILPHRITALIGASGSGKSVIARLVMGLLAPDRGDVRVGGESILGLAERDLERVRARIGFVFQHAALLDWLSVAENIAFPLVERRHTSAGEVRARVDESLERLGLTPLRHRMPYELSTGERKRVGLARAIVMQPEIIIYDEPTTGQDPVRTGEIDDMIVRIQEQLDVTTLVISHDMASTFRIAHTIAMIHEGKIVACGPPAELAASTDAYVRHFLHASAVPSLST